MATYTADYEPIADSNLDALAAELGAMQVIAKALGDIRDVDTRRRVLTWANERLVVTAAVPAALPARAAQIAQVEVDDTLEVDSLAEFFERPQNAAELLALHAAAIESEQVQSAFENEARGGALGKLVRGVSRGLAGLVAQWQTA